MNCEHIIKKVTAFIIEAEKPPCDKDIIYAAECLKYKVISRSQTGDSLSNRFNRHCSDIECLPNRGKFQSHFHENDCPVDTDLEMNQTQ